jgi:hypothetical protein
MATMRLPLAVLIAIPVAVFPAGDAALDRETLRGLKAVNVVIDPVHAELENQGIIPDDLRAQIQTQLQNAGIAVDENAREFLGVRILPARQKNGPYSISASLGLYQPVQLVRDAKIRTATQTWEVESVSVVQPKLLRTSSMSVVGQLVDAFIAAYQSVNTP